MARRAIGGTGGGFAGGLFQGLLASEDTRRKRGQEERALMLTESRIETEAVDRQAKALKMQIDQDTYDEAKRQRVRDKQLQDFTQSKMFVTDMEQVMNDQGGFTNKEVVRMRDFSGAKGMENFLQAQRDIVAFSLKNGNVPADKMNAVLKYGMDIQKKIGQKTFLRNLKNLNTDEAKNLIMNGLGITEYKNAQFDASGGNPRIIYQDKNGVQSISIATQLLDLELYSQIMKGELDKSEIEENRAGAQKDITDANLNKYLEQSLRPQELKVKQGKLSNEEFKADIDAINKWSEELRKRNENFQTSFATQSLYESRYPIENIQNIQGRTAIEKKALEGEYKALMRGMPDYERGATASVLNTLATFNRDFTGDRIAYPLVAESIVRHLRDPLKFADKYAKALALTTEKQPYPVIEGVKYNKEIAEQIIQQSIPQIMNQAFGGVYQ